MTVKLTNILKNVAVAAALLVAGTANAGLYNFQLSGGHTATWQLDTSVAPDFATNKGAIQYFATGGALNNWSFGNAFLAFASDTAGGGLMVYDDGKWGSFRLVGVQLYTGSEFNPLFKAGTFSLFDQYSQASTAVTVTDLTAPADVPEPATGALLAGGMALLAALRKRRQAK